MSRVSSVVVIALLALGAMSVSGEKCDSSLMIDRWGSCKRNPTCCKDGDECGTRNVCKLPLKHCDKIHDRKMTVNGLEFDVKVAGPKSGDLVVLLHGFPETNHMWVEQIRALAKAGFRVMAPNQRGYSSGAQPDAVADYESPKLASDILKLATKMGYWRFHLVGHDWGSAIAWYLASIHGDRVRTLTTLAIPHIPAFFEALADPTCEQRNSSAYIQSFILDNFELVLLANDKARLARVYEGMTEEDRAFNLDFFDVPTMKSALNWYRATFREDSKPIPEVPVRNIVTHFIWGMRDNAVARCATDKVPPYVESPYKFTALNSTHWMVSTHGDVVTAAILQQTKYSSY